MFHVIVALPKLEDAKNIKMMLIRQGYEVALACNLGAQAIAKANELDEGIVICGYRLPDMHYSDLFQYLPKGFEMLLLASPNKLEGVMNHIVCLSMPIKSYDLMSTLEMMTLNYRRRKKKEKDKKKRRSEEEVVILQRAKTLLMERNHFSEEEAHRYIQKTSMDSGTNMIETAQMILSLM